MNSHVQLGVLNPSWFMNKVCCDCVVQYGTKGEENWSFNVLKLVTQDNTYLTPTRRYDRTRIRVDLDSFDRTAIKQIVHAFYERREYPTLTAVRREAKGKGVFFGWTVLFMEMFEGDGIFIQKT